MSELVLLPSFWGCTKPALGLSSQHRLHVASSPGLYYPPLMLHHQRAVIRSVAVEKPEKSTASRPLEKSTARILVHGHVSTLPAQLGLFQTKLKVFFNFNCSGQSQKPDSHVILAWDLIAVEEWMGNHWSLLQGIPDVDVWMQHTSLWRLCSGDGG